MELKYKTKKMVQKIFGIILIFLAVLSAILTNDSTAALLIAPLGLYALFTKEYILTL